MKKIFEEGKVLKVQNCETSKVAFGQIWREIKEGQEAYEITINGDYPETGGSSFDDLSLAQTVLINKLRESV